MSKEAVKLISKDTARVWLIKADKPIKDNVKKEASDGS
jgi:hypothetical protein